MNKYSGNILLVIAICGFCISSAGHTKQPNPYAIGPETIIIHAGRLLDVPGNQAKTATNHCCQGRKDRQRP